MQRPLASTLFPYTTLFRSHPLTGRARRVDGRQTRKPPAKNIGKHPIRGRGRSHSFVPWHANSAARRGRHSWSSTTGLVARSEEHTSELQSHVNLVCRLLLE